MPSASSYTAVRRSCSASMPAVLQRLAIVFFAAAAPAFAQPALPEAFQGLAWGANELEIGARFSAAKAADCNPASRKAAGERREACDSPVVTGYAVAGVPFRLTLHLSADTRLLARVSLSYSGEAEPPPPQLSQDNRWGERHRQLRNLLAQRYGPPENANVSNEPGSFIASARWRAGWTLIDLHSMFFHRAANGPAREQYEIVYQPITAGDAGKL
jgi:hypothetical protein